MPIIAMESIIPPMNGYSVNGFTVRASSESTTSTNAWRAFDGNDTTEWLTKAQTRNYWIDVKLPAPSAVNFVYIRGRASEFPTSLTISVSNDGTNWTPYTFSDRSTFTPIPTKPNVFVVPISSDFSGYLYYRFTFPASTATSKNPGLSEIRLFKRSEKYTGSLSPSVYPELASAIVDCRWPFQFVSNGGNVNLNVSLSCGISNATISSIVMYIDGLPIQANKPIQTAYPVPVFTWSGSLPPGEHEVTFDSTGVTFAGSNMLYMTATED
jgi:hypothetical protein